MAIAVLAWLVGIPLLGGLTGMRTMTPMAVLCWFAYQGHLPVHYDWAFWTTKLVTVIVFGVLAVGELIGDKLPQTPNRTAIGPLLARLVFGGMVGAIAATGLRGPVMEGVILGAASAYAGTYLGFHIRQHLVRVNGFKDFYVAIVEDVLVIGGSFIAMGLITG